MIISHHAISQYRKRTDSRAEVKEVRLCCKTWKKATCEGTDSEGWQPMIQYGGEYYDDNLPRIGNIGLDTELPPLKFCPWCGKKL